MKQSITFGGITAAPGTKTCGWAPVLDTDYKLPVTVINGAKEGQSVLLTSAFTAVSILLLKQYSAWRKA